MLVYLDNILSIVLKLPQEIQLELAQRAKALRKAHGLSQSQLAEKSGVSFGSIKRFERSGKISLESLLKIAFVLDALASFEQLFPPKPFMPGSLDEIINSKR